jgi:hypothetical protein
MQHLLVPLEVQVGMEAPLEQDLVPAQVHCLADLLNQDLSIEDVSIGVANSPEESTEVADGCADVRVVDISVDVVRSKRLRVAPSAHRVGGTAQFQERGRTKQLEPLVETQAPAVKGAA